MVIWPQSKAGKERSWRSENSSQSRWKVSAATLRDLWSQPFVKITPPISQKMESISGKGSSITRTKGRCASGTRRYTKNLEVWLLRSHYKGHALAKRFKLQ